MGAPKPRARVVLADETLSVPLVVGRQLRASLATGDLSFGSRAELVHYLVDAQAQRGFDMVVRLLDKRDYSERQLAERLERDGYWDKPARAVLERAIRLRLVDDGRFADVFIRSKMGAGWGLGRIERELRRRGIEPDALEGWPEQYQETPELERALALASRRRLTGKDPYAKLVRFLCGRGFSAPVAHEVAQRLAHDGEAAWWVPRQGALRASRQGLRPKCLARLGKQRDADGVAYVWSRPSP
jgi:regulatory protein